MIGDNGHSYFHEHCSVNLETVKRDHCCDTFGVGITSITKSYELLKNSSKAGHPWISIVLVYELVYEL